MKMRLQNMSIEEIDSEIAENVKSANGWHREFSKGVQVRDNRIMQSTAGTAHTQRVLVLQNEKIIRQNDEIISLLRKIAGEG